MLFMNVQLSSEEVKELILGNGAALVRYATALGRIPERAGL